ncbi:immunity 22 family protein [Pseudomonas sp. KNUC1026]|uniref:immunity 22 family protein n=1 Tax=Pseudomonas sp. KNUC1026 TaxID=2893890 RepID=UPI001F2D3515|nr:immunity 22 family protein [Pseudomonas sp. KNUC1026]UFH51283.1 immunity 22 family protein [Pseudomonas sp. KNUC1026]
MNTYNLENYEKVHVWVGTNFTPESEYQKYFELDYSVEGDFDDPAYRVCGFCRDVGAKWYDEDFIGIIARRAKPVAVEEILKDAPIDPSDWARAMAACAALGIAEANATFWYTDGDGVLSIPPENSYNGLRYLGLFEGS